MKKQNTKPTIESEVEMLRKLQIEKEKRMKQFAKELEELMVKHNCEIIPLMTLSPGGIKSDIQINAK